MKNAIIFLFAVSILGSCTIKNKAIVSEKYIDSLLAISTLSKYEQGIKADLSFWKNKYKADPESATFAQKYAGMLVSNFQIYGNINDLILAESIIEKLNSLQTNTDSGICRNLANYAGLQHQFTKAYTFANIASQIGDNQYFSQLLLFDAAFELGKMDQAKTILNKIKKKYEYAYYFRLAKMKHYDGDLEAAQMAMETAIQLSNSNVYLQQKSLSNLADLQLHNGDYEAASQNFIKSLALDHADFHSLKGLGLIAQNYDKNYKLAQLIFDHLAQKTKAPDIYFNLTSLAQAQGNKTAELKYAQLFAEKASQKTYGNMYNKYLIELFEGSLNDSKAMLTVCENEIKIRNTPQTNAWYAWALHQNFQKEKALTIYNKQVKEKPLEGLELYFMSKMMLLEKKENLAKLYSKAAYKNRFELMPNSKNELEKTINI